MVDILRSILRAMKMVEIRLRVKIDRRADYKNTLGQYFYRKERIVINLFNLKALKWDRLLSAVNGITNHEITHHHLKGVRSSDHTKELICEKMEVFRVDW
jgi:hypothetical protein